MNDLTERLRRLIEELEAEVLVKDSMLEAQRTLLELRNYQIKELREKDDE